MVFPTKPKQHPNITNTHLPNKYDLDSEAHPVLYIISRCHVLLFVRQSRATVPPKTMFFATDFGAFLGSSRAESITSWWSSKGTLTIGRLEPDKFTIWPHQKRKEERNIHPNHHFSRSILNMSNFGGWQAFFAQGEQITDDGKSSIVECRISRCDIPPSSQITERFPSDQWNHFPSHLP